MICQDTKCNGLNEAVRDGFRKSELLWLDVSGRYKSKCRNYFSLSVSDITARDGIHVFHKLKHRFTEVKLVESQLGAINS